MAVFIPVEETQAVAQKGVRDFFRVAWVEKLVTIIGKEVLEVAVVVVVIKYGETVVEVGVEEGTPGEVVEVIKMIPVEEGEDRTMQGKIRETNVATTTIELVMVR